MTALLNAGGGVITDETNVDVISAGLEVGNYSSIVIDGIEPNIPNNFIHW